MMKKYYSGLETLRVLALFFVSAYHFMPSFIKGGFLGVIIFFILSGFFLTKTVVESDNFSYFSFIKKRAKRLWIPLALWLILVALWIMMFQPKLLYNFKWDFIHSLIFNNHQYQLSLKQSYFERWNNFSPFIHLWTLSMEAQFSLLLPLLFLLLRKLKYSPKKLSKLFQFLFLGSLIYSVVMLFVLNDLTQYYYRIDTRMYAFFGGCFLYFSYSKFKLNKSSFWVLLGLLTTALIFSPDSHIITYALIAPLFTFISLHLMALCIKHSDLLSFSKISLLGQRSYAYYLTQYSIQVIGFQALSKTSLDFGLKILILVLVWFIIGELFYQLTLNRIKATYLALIGCVIAASLPSIVEAQRTQGMQLKLPTFPIQTSTLSPINFNNVFTFDFSDPLPTTIGTKSVNHLNVSEQARKNHALSNYYFIGDSVLATAQSSLSTYFPGSTLDNVVGRQFWDLPELIKDKVNLADTFIINLGTNGYIRESDINNVLEQLKNKKIYFINLNVDKEWEKPNNQLLSNVASKHDNVYLIDWKTECLNDSQFFYNDMIHPNQEGSQLISMLILHSLTITE